MNRAQEKRELIKAFNKLTTRRTEGHLSMAVYIWNVNGLPSALEFLAKMKEYDQTEVQV